MILTTIPLTARAAITASGRRMRWTIRLHLWKSLLALATALWIVTVLAVRWI